MYAVRAVAHKTAGKAFEMKSMYAAIVRNGVNRSGPEPIQRGLKTGRGGDQGEDVKECRVCNGLSRQA